LTVAEAFAIRDLFSACGWLGVAMPDASTGESCEFLGRSARRYELQNSKYTTVSITEDDETGLIMELQAISAEHGEQRLKVTQMAIVPWQSELFPHFEPPKVAPRGL
jgi:hypothetical protein